MNFPDASLLLAGFVLAHAAWSISDLPKGELLVPLAVVEHAGKRELTRFEADSQEAAVAKGKATMGKLGTSVDAWAFVRDGILRESGGAVDALTVDFWAKGMKAPARLIQRYEPFAKRGKFKLLGQPMFIINDEAQKPEEAKPWSAVLLRGIQQHPVAKGLWPSWLQEEKQ
jgi:hypothetical protein